MKVIEIRKGSVPGCTVLGLNGPIDQEHFSCFLDCALGRKRLGSLDIQKAGPKSLRVAGNLTKERIEAINDCLELAHPKNQGKRAAGELQKLANNLGLPIRDLPPET